MFFNKENFTIYPHHSDYLLISHSCDWSVETDGGITFKELWDIIQNHCDNCGK